jgi:hypothetical protein
MDAYRIKTGKQVAIKCVINNPSECLIVAEFSQPDVDERPENHCVPFHELFAVPGTSKSDYFLVTPLLRDYNQPDFDTVGQFVDFVGQMLEVC